MVGGAAVIWDAAVGGGVFFLAGLGAAGQGHVSVGWAGIVCVYT